MIAPFCDEIAFLDADLGDPPGQLGGDVDALDLDAAVGDCEDRAGTRAAVWLLQ